MKTFFLISTFFLSSWALAAMPTTLSPKKSEQSLKKNVLLGGDEICETTPAKKGSIEEIVRRHTVKVLANGEHRCTGTAIKNNLILLAAHCVDVSEKGVKYSIRAYSEETRGYQEFEVDKVTRSLSESRPDMAILRLKKALPAANVIPPLEGKCDDKEIVQAGFGLTETGAASTCPKFAFYKREKPIFVPGFNLPLAIDSTFFAVPKQNVFPRANISCNGDSGGPIFCRSSKKWAFAGILTAVVPKVPDDPAWIAERKICENYDHPERLKHCIESCRLSQGIVGFELNKSAGTINDMKAYFPDPQPSQEENAEEGSTRSGG